MKTNQPKAKKTKKPITILHIVNRLHQGGKPSKEDPPLKEYPEIIKTPECEINIHPKMVFHELCNKSSQNFSKTQKNLDSLIIGKKLPTNSHPQAKKIFQKQIQKKFIKKNFIKKNLCKSKSSKDLIPVSVGSRYDRRSSQYNPESIISRESTPSEFPLLRNTVKYLLSEDKRSQIKSNSRNIFSPLSLGSPKNCEVRSPKLDPIGQICTPDVERAGIGSLNRKIKKSKTVRKLEKVEESKIKKSPSFKTKLRNTQNLGFKVDNSVSTCEWVQKIKERQLLNSPKIQSESRFLSPAKTSRAAPSDLTWEDYISKIMVETRIKKTQSIATPRYPKHLAHILQKLK